MHRPEFAALAGISPSYLADIENGRRSPDAGVIISLARALGVPSGELFELYDDRVDKPPTLTIPIPDSLADSPEDLQAIKDFIRAREALRKIEPTPAQEAAAAVKGKKKSKPPAA
jgi:transcriptional regulator with XRE-family HTH domain